MEEEGNGRMLYDVNGGVFDTQAMAVDANKASIKSDDLVIVAVNCLVNTRT